MLAVDPGLQRSGVGRALVEAVVAHARTLEGINAVSLTTGSNWTAAHRLYERLGFQAVAEISPGLAALMREEASRGLDPATRVAMILLPAQVRA